MNRGLKISWKKGILKSINRKGASDGMKVKAARKRPSKKTIRESLSMGMLALPGIALLIIFNYLPMFGIVIAFKNFLPLKGIWGSDWCGFDNFKFFFTSSDAVRTIRNTVLYNLVWMVTGTFAGVGMALLFYNLKSRKALKIYNTVILIPKFLSAVLLSFLVEIFLGYRFGVVNQLMDMIGAARTDWYLEVSIWPFVLTFVHTWATVGVGSMIYYASLMGLDEGLLEAAKLDGANKLQQIWHVMIPHLIPIIVIQNILAIGNMFTGDFGLFYQVPKDSGQLYPVTDIINTYTFRALKSGNLARGAAVGLFQSAAGFVTVLVTNQIVKKISPENSLF